MEPGTQGGEFRGRPMEMHGRPLDVLLQVAAVLLLPGQDEVVPDASQEVRLQADDVVGECDSDRAGLSGLQQEGMPNGPRSCRHTVSRVVARDKPVATLVVIPREWPA